MTLDNMTQAEIDKQMAERQVTYNQVSELTSRIKQAAQQAQG